MDNLFQNIYTRANKKRVYFLISLFFCAFAQPAWVGFLTPLSAFCCFALFWYSIRCFSQKKRTYVSFIWFFLVQLVHLSWMSSIKYQGWGILLLYILLSIAMAFQFCVISLYFPYKKCSWMGAFFIASLWVIMEWMRTFFMCGFTWNVVAMMHAYYVVPLQIASIAGVYGMSFLIIFANVALYKACIERVNKSVWIIALFLAAFPYLYGMGYLFLHSYQKFCPKLQTALIQTSLFPEQKEFIGDYKSYISPSEQWYRILKFLQDHTKEIDLIALPEGALPFEAGQYMYPLEECKAIWKKVFGNESLQYMPELTKDLAYISPKGSVFINNNFWVQSLSKYFSADVIIGLKSKEELTEKTYNSALFCQPKQKSFEKYHKRILVPIGEYFPFSWCQSFAEKMGIIGEFSWGKSAKLFFSKVPLAVSICYEETYGRIIRESRILGAELFVNISNDAWFPNSKLAKQHFYHGRVRAVENGVPLLRACNTGYTVATDCFGNIIKAMELKNGSFEKLAGALYVDVPLQKISTIYTFFGEGLIIGISMLFVILRLRKK